MCRLLSTVLLFATLLLRASDPGDKLMHAGVAEFTAAYQAWDGPRFGAAADLFRQATVQAPGSGAGFYWLGVAEFHRLLQLQTQPASRTNQVAVAAAMDAALDALETAVKLDGRDAESHALLGTLYGMKIDGNLIRAMRFGPRVAEHQERALEFGASNPRVQYLLGTCQFHTARKPAAIREALATLLAAESLFAAEAQGPAPPLQPRWGWTSCLTFIGRSYERLGRTSEAAAYYGKALAGHPSDHLAREGLNRVTGKN